MFAKQGAKVVGCDINAAAAEETCVLARRDGLEIDNLDSFDLTDPAAAQSFVTNAVERHGGIDILVNAAATAVFAWLPEMQYSDWRKTLTGELDIVFLVCQAAWPHLIARGGGAIVNFASVNAY